MSNLNQNTSYRPIGSFDDSHVLETQRPMKFDIATEDTPTKWRSTKRNGTAFKRAVNHLWILEWLSWSVALLAIAGIVAVLAAFNYRPIPEWPYGITLGALVSLLATIANVGLAGPISAGLGQAKWLWYAKERKMADFELTDDARPYKSAILLVRGKGGVIAIWGAVLTIITLAVGPFVQQVVQYEDKALQSIAASVPIATEYDTFDLGGILETDVSLDMKAAIQRGLLDINANSSTFFVSPQCPTGNCTWAPYTTLGVCARCTDLSSHLTVKTHNDSSVTTSLPNNVTLNSYSGQTKQGFIAMTVNTTSDLLANLIPSIAYTDWSEPLVDVFTIVAQYGNLNDNLHGPYASECILQFCVQDHSSAVANGTFTEKDLNTPRYINDSASSSTLLTDGGKNYSVEFETYKGFWTYFEDMFNTQVHQQNGLSPVSEWPDDVSQSIFYWTNRSHDHTPIQMFNNLASSMSLHVRSVSNVSSPGMATSFQSVVSVHWLWMILPFALLALVLAYLLVVVCVSKAKKQEPWKTSSAAVLMHGLMDDESRGLVEGIERLDEMEDISSQLRMKIVRITESGQMSGKEEEGSHIGLIARY